MHAGRLFDFLTGLSLKTYYDKSELVNPTGVPYPETLHRELRDSKILIAVINRDWLDRVGELHDEKDWVRYELLEAHPSKGKRFIPIYMGVEPADLAGKLPAVLDFLPDMLSHLCWRIFEEAEKAQLKSLLRASLPGEPLACKVADTPRLELLCDRARAETCFGHVVELQRNSADATGWLLFGETEQAPGEMFERIRAFTLEQHLYRRRFSKPLTVQLQLQEFSEESEIVPDEMLFAILERAANALKVDVPDRPTGLRDILIRKSISLFVFHAVVQVASARQAECWRKRFEELLRQFAPAPTSGDRNAEGAQVVFALALTYPAMHNALLPRLRQRIATASPALGRWLVPHPRAYFEAAFPRHFAGDDEPFTYPTGRLQTSRLRPVNRQHVSDWFGNDLVRGHIRSTGSGKVVLDSFEHRPERPMAEVLIELASLLATQSTAFGAET